MALSAGKKNILANGLWKLVVRDAKKGNKGTILDGGLEFPQGGGGLAKTGSGRE